MNNLIENEKVIRDIILMLFKKGYMAQKLNEYGSDVFALKSILDRLESFTSGVYYPIEFKTQLAQEFKVLDSIPCEYEIHRKRLVSNALKSITSSKQYDIEYYKDEYLLRFPELRNKEFDMNTFYMYIYDYIDYIEKELDILNTHTEKDYFKENSNKLSCYATNKDYYLCLLFLIKECPELLDCIPFVENVNEVSSYSKQEVTSKLAVESLIAQHSKK